MGSDDGKILKFDFEVPNESAENSTYRLSFEPTILTQLTSEDEKLPKKIIFLWKSPTNSILFATHDGGTSSLYEFNLESGKIENSVINLTRDGATVSCFCYW